jgi:hypothetical protein
MKRTDFLLPLVLASIICFSACTFPSPRYTKYSASTPAFAAELPQIAVATQTATLPAPVCPDASAFGKIYSHWPNLFTLTSTTPKFTWFYGRPAGSVKPWASECVPESYTLIISTGPDFEDEIIVPVTNPSVVADPTKLTMEWTLEKALQPVKVYRWVVIGHANGMTLEEWKIADIHNDALWPPLNSVNMTYKRTTFRTGPECAPGQIPVPILTSPLTGDVIQTLNPILTWEAGTCMPIVFWIEISTQPTFGNPQFSVDPSLPGDYTSQSQRNYPYASINYTLRDCTRYYWHVKGGGEIINQAREWGSYSDTGMFNVDLGQCPAPTPSYVPPANTATPTNVPAVVCAGLTPADCNKYPGQCKWVWPPPTIRGPGSCQSK